MELTLRAKSTALKQSIGSETFEETALEHLDPFRYVQYDVGKLYRGAIGGRAVRRPGGTGHARKQNSRKD